MRSYGPDPAQVYDVVAPQAPVGATVLVVHGGFWRPTIDRTHTSEQVAGLAAAGYHVAVAEYRRWRMPLSSLPDSPAPGAGPGSPTVSALGTRAVGATAGRGWWHETSTDIEAVVHAVAADETLPAPLILVGHSAGGQLVAWVAGVPWASAVQGLVGVVALAGCVDLSVVDDLRLGADAAHDFLGGSPSEVPVAWEAADPARHLPAQIPVRLVSGTVDEEVPVEVSRSYVAKALASVPVTSPRPDVSLDVVEGADHFDVIDPASAAWPHVLAAIASLT